MKLQFAGPCGAHRYTGPARRPIGHCWSTQGASQASITTKVEPPTAISLDGRWPASFLTATRPGTISTCGNISLRLSRYYCDVFDNNVTAAHSCLTQPCVTSAVKLSRLAAVTRRSTG